ncbi:hypothetical protein [Natronolimnobius baerhuensis]|uniref:Uncharacterized protein n=1 Tax=Natronolimnobius baerhuensis TaxID=253108 RepID=A0A202E6T7_9EURY|nr:hypothetical protein [Natronolimnobius baerhuensis]OVE83972.1 hypothetical protein B2G88_16340 [Natronolimnobius baerhuensis]
MAPTLSDGLLALLYAVLVLIGAMLVIPDPTLVFNFLVGIVGLSVVGYALVDGSLRDLGWGIAALYVVGIIVAVLESAARETLLETGLYGGVLQGTVVIAVCSLLGTYLTVRRRGPPVDLSR